MAQNKLRADEFVNPGLITTTDALVFFAGILTGVLSGIVVQYISVKYIQKKHGPKCITKEDLIEMKPMEVVLKASGNKKEFKEY